MADPPGSLSLAAELQSIKARLEELSRRKIVAPVCRVRLTTDATLPAGGNIWAQGGWVATEDSGMFTPSSGDGFPCYITVPASGSYSVHYHSSAAGPSPSHAHAAKVTVNGRDVAANSIATDSRGYPPSGADGCPLDAIRSHYRLVVGDRLYWSNWSSATATLRASSLGVPTEVWVRFLGSQ